MKSWIQLSLIILIGIVTSCTSQTDMAKNIKHFENKYEHFSIEAEDIYNFTNSHSSKSTIDSNDLNMRIDYKFELINDTCLYFVQNNLTQFYNEQDLELGWKLGQESFWNGLLSTDTDKSDFKEYKNSKLFKFGDYSEYSELPIDDDKAIIVYHVKLNNLIIHYAYLILQDKKEELIKKLMQKLEKIQNDE